MCHVAMYLSSYQNIKLPFKIPIRSLALYSYHNCFIRRIFLSMFMYILKVITVLVQKVSYSNVQIRMTSCFIVGNKYFYWNKQTIYFIREVLCWANWVLPWYTPECAVQYLFCNITYKPYDSYMLHIKHTAQSNQ